MKRHILVDTQGLLMHAIVHAADIQDRDGGVLVMATLFGLYPFLLKLYADAGYQGPNFQQGLARACREVNVEIVRRCDTGKFVVLPKRVRRSAPNRRTHHRLAEPLPAPEQGLGMPEPKRHRLPPLGVGSTDAAKALPFINMILDRL
jgi:transposase